MFKHFTRVGYTKRATEHTNIYRCFHILNNIPSFHHVPAILEHLMVLFLWPTLAASSSSWYQHDGVLLVDVPPADVCHQNKKNYHFRISLIRFANIKMSQQETPSLFHMHKKKKKKIKIKCKKYHFAAWFFWKLILSLLKIFLNFLKRHKFFMKYHTSSPYLISCSCCLLNLSWFLSSSSLRNSSCCLIRSVSKETSNNETF